LQTLIASQAGYRAFLTPARGNLAAPDQKIVKEHSPDYEKNQRQVNPANDPRTDCSGVTCHAAISGGGTEVHPAFREVSVRADMTLPAGLRQVVGIDHRVRI
jgi:hypothetical protein